VADTLAYYDTATSTAVKSFIVQALYYKSVVALVFTLTRVVNYAPRVMLQIVLSLTVVIYNRNMLIVQTTGGKNCQLTCSYSDKILNSTLFVRPYNLFLYDDIEM
jgi:hypothetical protein